MKPLLTVFFCSIVTLCAAQIINIEDKRTRNMDSISWHETLELGAHIYKNTQSVLSLTASAQIEFQYLNKRLLSITSANFVRAGESDFVNEGFQHLRYNNSFNNWLTFELFGQVQYNEQANIKLRALGGTGLRFEIMQKEKQRAHLGISYMYEYDEETINEVIHQDSRLNTYVSFRLKPVDIFTLTSTTYYQPLFDRFSDYRLSSSTSANFAFNKRLRFKTTYSIIYDSRASAGAPTTTYRLGNSLSYTF